MIWQYQQAFTSHNAGAAYEFFYFGSISSMLNPVMADRVGVLMAKLFSGGYEIKGREFNRGREDTSDLLTCIGLVMLLNGAAGAVKGSALGGNLQYAMAGGGTMDAAMAITAENAMVIAALSSMYSDTSNDGIIRRIEGETETGNTNHGNQRLKERGFTDKKVTDIMENYSQKVYQEGGRTVYAKKNGNYYDVIITNTDGEIVTAVGGNTKSLKTWKDVTRMLNNNGGYSTLPY